MSTKYLFLTHEAGDMGKKPDYLPMTGKTRNQNSRFMGMTHI
jgi:hypothetical protein